MIKINLLPVRASKKKETVRQQVSISILSIIGVLSVCFSLYFVTLSKIQATKNEITRSEQELQQLKTKIGEIDNIKKLQAEVKKKLDILSQLRKEKSGPINRLAKLTGSMPEKLWLTKYAETAGTIAFSGVGSSEEDIAIFLKNLQGIQDFSNVELLVSEQADIGPTKVKKFDASLKLANLVKQEPQKPAGK